MPNSVLLIDDDEVDRLAVRRALAKSALEADISEAADRASALNCLSSRTFDCIVLDHDLPDADGLSLIHELRGSAARDTAIIMLTGRGDEHLAVELMKAGATDYLCKADLSPDHLATAIRSAVRLSTEQQQVRTAHEALRASEIFHRSVLDSLPSQVVVVDAQGMIISFNEAWRRFAAQYASPEVQDAGLHSGYSEACRLILKQTPEEVRDISSGVSSILREQQDDFFREVSCRTSDSTYWFSLLAARLSGTCAGVVISHTDVTARKTAEERLVYQALHDDLTRLPNKILLFDRLQSAIQRLSRQSDRIVAALFLDLDHFKVVNDSLGHHAGDAFLVETACRLSTAVRAGDFVARLGGDEFVVLLDDLKDEQQAYKVAEKIQKAIAKPVRIQGQGFSLTVSIGIVLVDGSDNAEAVLRNADTAMYRAKAGGRSRFALFGNEMHAAAVETMKLRRDLPTAITNGELFLEYQPIIALESDSLAGFEALVRWRRPNGTIAGPDQFIPFAEDSGLISAVDRFALTEASRQIREWRRRFPAESMPYVSVNLSAHNIRRREIVSEIDAILIEADAPRESLVLELTESAYAECAESVVNTLQALRGCGIRIYIDDFGVGYSSLSYLSRLPIDAVKIDRSFVRQSAASGEGLEVIRAITALARALRFQVVAEGIETEEQADLVRALDCDFGQGYLYGRPVGVDAASAILAARFDGRSQQDCPSRLQSLHGGSRSVVS